MNALDITVLLIAVIFFGLGIYHGLIKSVSSLGSVILGLFLAKKVSPVITEIFSYLHIPNSRGLLGFLIAFLFFFVLLKVAFHFIQKFSKASGLSLLDRSLGGMLGFCKGLIIAVLMVTIMQITLPRDSTILKESAFLPYSNRIISMATGLIPKSIISHAHRVHK